MLSIQARIKTHATVSPNYLLGVCVPLARFFFFDYCIDISVTVRNAESHTRFFLLTRREFVLSIQARIKKLLLQFRQIICLVRRAFGTLFCFVIVEYFATKCALQIAIRTWVILRLRFCENKGCVLGK